MALFAAARRAASSSLPLLRASASRGAATRGQALLRPLAAAAARPMPFSSATALKPSSDDELLRVVKAEIKFAEDCDDHDRVEEVPDSFPFKITDKKGFNDITLTRTYQGEKIEVLVSMPNLVTGDEPEHDQDEDDKEKDDDQDDSEKPPKSTLPLTVTITKSSSGPSLEFTCTAYPDEILIDTLSVKQPSANLEEEDIAYEGPDFNDLDENLQRAFHKYLELRGITPMTTNFLHEYMINKDSREYLFWLNKLKDFVKL
ncbi:uncharacterized protein At2g39795, mitochondrial-like [Hordeum vulgare subsp. vulgare]|uniref:Mitochondrial glycoprotein n=1 Tax=Hordeum vulgare subsp. vulgare TaxID=112509 RepID=A0A8I6XAP9_HORVV|nr:uncharacterized protein At2g39795, mitochondrial-like [Hordeum vulgare subsp. vulgare]